LTLFSGEAVVVEVIASIMVDVVCSTALLVALTITEATVVVADSVVALTESMLVRSSYLKAAQHYFSCDDYSGSMTFAVIKSNQWLIERGNWQTISRFAVCEMSKRAKDGAMALMHRTSLQ